MISLTCIVPGVPVPQGRGRIVQPFAKGGGRAARPMIMDPLRSRDWKVDARTHYWIAIRKAGYKFPLYAREVPVRLHVHAVFPRPLADKEGPAYPHVKSRGDADNVLKAVQDAGNGVLWVDDAQVCLATVSKWVAAYDCQPYVRVSVAPWQDTGTDQPPDWPAWSESALASASARR